MPLRDGRKIIGLPSATGTKYRYVNGNGTRHASPQSNIRHFNHDVCSVRDARLFASDCAVELTPHQTSVLVLLVSELATNCVKHSAGDFDVSIDIDARSARVEVTDEGPGWPEMRKPHDHEVSGRGLLVVEALSGSWGVVPDNPNGGKTVWFSMSLA